MDKSRQGQRHGPDKSSMHYGHSKQGTKGTEAAMCKLNNAMEVVVMVGRDGGWGSWKYWIISVMRPWLKLGSNWIKLPFICSGLDNRLKKKKKKSEVCSTVPKYHLSSPLHKSTICAFKHTHVPPHNKCTETRHTQKPKKKKKETRRTQKLRRPPPWTKGRVGVMAGGGQLLCLLPRWARPMCPPKSRHAPSKRKVKIRKFNLFDNFPE